MTPFASLAYPFLPADEGAAAAVVEAPGDWSFHAEALPPDAEAVVWGRLPGASSDLLRRAAAREATLAGLGRHIPARLSIAAVHRLPPRALGTGARPRLRAALHAGVLVEIVSRSGARRVLDAVATAAGAPVLGGRIHAGAGGTVLVQARLADGSRAVLRVARAGTAGDPACLGDTLEALAQAGVPLAPRLLAHGRAARASWIAEQELPGRRPPRATSTLVQQVVEACRRFPRSDDPPTAPLDDLRGAARRLPERAPALTRLSSELAPVLRDLPSVLRHGDLWTGNLLVDRERVVGLIDWDAMHPRGVPGSDLVQLLATDARRRAHQPLGEAFLGRPWRSMAFHRATAAYWPAVGTAAVPALLDAAGIAWWASEVHHTLVRLPHRADDERWIATNVDAVLTALLG